MAVYTYQPNPRLEAVIHDYYSVSKAALCKQADPVTRWDRLNYVLRMLREHNQDLIASYSPKHLYFFVDDVTSPIR